MNESRKLELEIFTTASDIPAVDRAAFLDDACQGDDNLRRKVEALLNANDRVGDFLEEAPRDRVPTMVEMEKVGERIGRYRLLQQIGEGGCGVVFMAEQEEPVRRMVALKIVKPGMDTRSVIARFEAERQALALMDHPSIAHVLDAGATEHGRPYFVMELVRGIKITDYCDQSNMPTKARLELFIQVCDAVQHAHQKGIIHRDIKPSNILVTNSVEGKPLPKVIDFGIAKATNGLKLTDKTLFTAFEMLIGTPAYMSPEQAALTSVDVDTRSDIYSLGVLLYELVTGTTPFDTRELLKSGLDEIRRVIQTKDALRPSTRLGTMIESTLTRISQQRQTDPPKLIRDVRGDLDWIAMKALEKDRSRRYPTANGLIMDIRRFLDGEVVLARPPSKIYKLHKLFTQHKLVISGLGAGLLGLIVLLAFLSLLLVREKKLRMQSDLLLADTLGNAYVQDGKPEEAEQVYLRALEIRRKVTPGFLPTAQSLDNLIWALLYQGKFHSAEALLNEFLTPANSNRNEYVDLLCLRSEVFSRSGNWSKAQADAARILEYRSEDYGAYHRLACLAVANRDLEVYRTVCQQIVARFSPASIPVVADQMAKDCLILPSSGVNLASVAAMADVAATKGQLEPAYPFYQCCKALAEYRLGHFDEAAKWAQFSAMNPFPYSQAEAFAILGMAKYKLNEPSEARSAVDKCEEVLNEKLPKFGMNDLGGDWRDWIIVHALLSEAQNLLVSGSSMTTNSIDSTNK